MLFKTKFPKPVGKRTVCTLHKKSKTRANKNCKNERYCQRTSPRARLESISSSAADFLAVRRACGLCEGSTGMEVAD